MQQPEVRGRLGQVSSGGLTSFADAGLFSLGARVTTDSAARVVSFLRDQLGQFIARSPIRAELETIRRAGTTGYLASLETLGGVIGQWSSMSAYGLPDDALSATAARVAGMSAAEIEGAAARWLAPDSMVVVVVGPAKALEPQLAKFGHVRVVELPPDPRVALPDTTVVTEASVARAREVIAAAVAAHGGDDSLRAVHDSLIRLKVSVGPTGSATSGEMIQTRKDPWRYSNVIRIEQMETRQILNGDHGWSITTGVSGVQAADSGQVSGMRSSFTGDIVHLLLGLGRPEARVASRGRSKLDAVEVDVIEVRSPEGVWQRYSFDAASHLLAGIDTYDDVPGMQAQTYGRRYGAYQVVSAIRWPFREMRLLNGQSSMRMETESVQVNIGINDRLFERPLSADR